MMYLPSNLRDILYCFTQHNRILRAGNITNVEGHGITTPNIYKTHSFCTQTKFRNTILMMKTVFDIDQNISRTF
jgi:hypothetical protein